jgi:hypothetical protein
VNALQYTRLPQWRRDWLVRHLWREGLERTPHQVHLTLKRMTRIVGDGPNWWRVWLQEGDGEFDVRRVRAERAWDFDDLIRHG